MRKRSSEASPAMKNAAETSAPPIYSVAVRELCAFTAKSGDLDLRFTPAPSAQEGIAGHAKVTAKRDAAHYESEILLASRFENLQVRGRADGFDNRTKRLEEIKTFKGRLDRQSTARQYSVIPMSKYSR